MLDRLVAITDAICQAKDKESLLRALEEGCATLGFDGFILFCHKARKADMILDATLTNFSKSYLHDYEHLGWSEGDFLLDDMLQADRTVTWSTAQLRFPDVKKQSYIDFLQASKLVTGLVTPLSHRPGTSSAFAITSSIGAPLQDGVTQAAAIIGNAAMAKAEMLGLCPEISVDAANAIRSLTGVQIEILSWIAEGKSNLDIATIMQLNERAVRYHVTEILRKLGVATRMQAAAIRRASGFIPKP